MYTSSRFSRDAASYKRPLLSGSVCGCVSLSVRSTACAIQTTFVLRCKACSGASHVAYRFVYCVLLFIAARYIITTHSILVPWFCTKMRQYISWSITMDIESAHCGPWCFTMAMSQPGPSCHCTVELQPKTSWKLELPMMMSDRQSPVMSGSVFSHGVLWLPQPSFNTDSRTSTYMQTSRIVSLRTVLDLEGKKSWPCPRRLGL